MSTSAAVPSFEDAQTREYADVVSVWNKLDNPSTLGHDEPSPCLITASLHESAIGMKLPPVFVSPGLEMNDWWQTAPICGDKKARAVIDVPMRRPQSSPKLVSVEPKAGMQAWEHWRRGGLVRVHAAELWTHMLSDFLPNESEGTAPCLLSAPGLSALADEFVPASHAASELNADAAAFVPRPREASRKRRARKPRVAAGKGVEEAPIISAWTRWRTLRAADLSRASEALDVLMGASMD